MTITIFVFFIGLSVGSFINALVYRLPQNLPIGKARSMCPHCKHVLSWKDLLPVLSFLWLKGKCRYCHKQISWQYPVVELITGLLFVLFYWYRLEYNWLLMANFELWLVIIRDWAVISFMTVIFLYDLKHWLILDNILILATVVIGGLNLYLGESWLLMLGTGVIIFCFFALQFYASNGRWIGGGDVKFGLLMGITLSWPLGIVALLLAYWLGAVIGIVLIVMGKKQRMSKVPFGTFLAVAVVFTLWQGQALLDWYLGLM